MSGLLPSPAQVVDLLAVAAAMAALTGLGSLLGRHRLAEADLLAGWGAAVIAVVAMGTLAGGGATAMGWLAFAVGSAAFVHRLARHRVAAVVPVVPVLVLLVPLLVLVVAMVPSQWDEFSQWLYSGRYLFDFDRFPAKGGPPFLGTFAAYPFGNVVPTLMASKLIGHFIDNAGIAVNTLVVAAYALLLARLMAEGAGQGRQRRIGWGLAATALLLATLLNPTFVPKIVFTAYADMATAVALAALGVLAWRVLAAIEAGESRASTVLAGQGGLVAALLVQLKQSNLVLLVLVAAGAVVVAARLRLLRRDAALALVLLLTPPLLVHLLWRHHVTLNAPGAEFVVRPLADWALDILPDILARMASVASNKGGHFTVVVVLGLLGLRGLVRMRTPFDRLAVLAAAVGLGYNLFLLFAYVAAFDRGEALTAASYWRYNIHIGAFLWAAALYGLAGLWGRRPLPQRWQRAAAAAAVVVAVAGPWAGLRYIRFDREGDKEQVRRMAAEMHDLLPAGAKLAAVDPEDAGFYVLQMRYLMHHRTGDVLRLYQSYPVPFTAPRLAQALDRFGADHAWVHSQDDAVRAAFGLPLATGAQYLLRRDGAGWVTLRVWPRDGW